ncbi:MAG: ABC transporter ATP-binding protein [Rubrivivax sp.]
MTGQAQALHADALRVELDADDGVVRAIDGIELAIARGRTFALVGESGCGKSMTALALLRLLPDNGRITAGEVRLGAQDLLALPEAAMRAVRGGRIGMIFQEPATSLNPVMRVGDQVVEAIEAHTVLRGAAARAKAVEWLARVGIPEPERRIDDYPFRLSGGQKQRVMIAMTLAAEPDFLIADEPTTALDVTIQAQILELLAQLQRERRMGLLLITHDLGVVAGMADDVALMYAGQVVEAASARDFFAAPRHPYAQALLRALPGQQRRGRPLEAIAGTVPALTQAFAGCRFEPRCAAAMSHCAHQPPRLLQVAPGHEVRCLLYEAGGARPAHRAAAAAVASAVAPAPPGPAAAHADQAAPADPLRAEGAAAAALLQVQGLRVGFPIRRGLLQRTRGVFQAVDSVSFEVGRGRTLALVGESGCGKTTIGKALVQLLRGQARIEGRALLEGRDLFALQGEALLAARRDIQIIFQDPFASLNPRMRVYDLLEEGLLALAPTLDAGARRTRLERLTDQVGLRRDALERFPHEFSGGQRQRIAIARALALQPRLVICDEPTSALDVSVQAQILNLLRELQRELSLSCLFITHNIGVVEYIADEVAVMRAGRLVEQGAADQMLGSPAHDYTRTLLAAVPRLTGAAAG